MIIKTNWGLQSFEDWLENDYKDTRHSSRVVTSTTPPVTVPCDSEGSNP